MRDMLDLGQIPAGQADKRGPLVRICQQLFDVGGSYAGPEPGVDRFENASVDRHEVRHECDWNADLLLYLGCMAMREHPVGGDAAVTLRKMGALTRRLACARHAGLGVDDYAGFEQSAANERAEREDGCGRIAAGARNERGLPQFVAVMLGEPVRGVTIRRRMRIPLGPCRRVAQPECSGQVEDPRSSGHQLRRHLRGDFIRQRQKDGVRFRNQALDVQRLDRRIPDPVQRGNPSRLGPSRGHGETHVGVRVPGEPAHELDSRVPRDSCDADPDRGIFIHPDD